jgi:hypothetical protein
MSTPEIDLHQKLMQEHDDETLQDSYENWLDTEVKPDLVKYLSSFQYEKFDLAAKFFHMYEAPSEGVLEWLWHYAKNDIEVYWGIAKREADYFNVSDLVEIYVEEFAVVDSYLQWKSEYDN